MARTGILTLRDIDDAKLSVIATDTPSGGLTFSAIIDIPGIQEFNIKFEFETGELKGDASVLDYFSKAKSLQGSVKNAQIGLAALAALSGGTTLATGSSPNESLEFVVSGDDLPNWVKIEGQCKYQGGLQTGGSGDAHFVGWKLKMSNFEIGLKTDEYVIASFEVVGINTNWVDPAVNKRRMFSIKENETATAINETVDSTPPTVTSSIPAADATDVAITINPQVIFSESIDPSSVSVDSVALVNAATGANVALDATTPVIVAGGTLTVKPAANLANDTDFILIVDAGVRDKAGNRMAARFTLRFTTVA